MPFKELSNLNVLCLICYKIADVIIQRLWKQAMEVACGYEHKWARQDYSRRRMYIRTPREPMLATPPEQLDVSGRCETSNYLFRFASMHLADDPPSFAHASSTIPRPFLLNRTRGHVFVLL